MHNSPSNPFREFRANSTLDYQPEWDVPSVNEQVSDWLESTIRNLNVRREPDPGLLIPILLSPQGYGKTHLFGRIAHRLGHEALFVFIPQVEDVRKPLDHIRWHTVESLFRARPGEHPVLARILARLCQPSFVRYFQDLPPSLAAKHQQQQQQLQEIPEAVLEIVGRVTELAPFFRLADSVTKSFPEVRADIVRALLLGWSPEVILVRRWLRGESLPENDLVRLGLAEEPPEAGQVLLAVANLLQFQMPIVLCCDQLEAVLVEIEEGPIRLTNALMGLLATVPNQIVVVSCLEDKWQDFLGHAHGSFQGRVRPFKLNPLTEPQAVDLVIRRLRSWSGAKPELGESWPFPEKEIAEFARKNQVGPRGLIKFCATAFDNWVEDGIPEDGMPKLALAHVDVGEDLPALFLNEWNKELEAIAGDPGRSPDELAEDRLHRATHEAIKLARETGNEFAGVRLENIQEENLRGTKKKPFLKLNLAAGTKKFSVAVAVTKIDNGTEFRGFFNALKSTITDFISAIAILHPKSELRMGPATQTDFDKYRQEGKLRTFSFVENPDAFARLESYLSLLDKARAKELQLGRLTVSDKDCLDLAIKTSVMDNLSLFDSLFAAWDKGSSTVEIEKPRSPEVIGAADKAPHAYEEQRIGISLTAKAVKVLPDIATATPPPKTSAPGAWASDKLKLLVEKLKLWSLPVEPNGLEVGPTFARLRVRPLGKTSVNRIRNKAEDLKIHLGLNVCPLVGSQAGYISVDVQLLDRKSVTLDNVLSETPVETENTPAFPLGQDVRGNTHWLNLSDPANCHLLVAGTTGSGKSEFLKAMVATLARRLSYQQLQFVLVDPKQVTFNLSGESPYFRNPVVNQVDDALPLIEECFKETERRYGLLKERRLENLAQLRGANALPRVVLIIDEFADLMADKDAKKTLEKPLKRIGALARAAGIHLVLATQRPEAGVVTPLLRSNLPGRVALQVASEADSKLILGAPDAFNLLGRGDLLWKHGGGLVRLQCPLVSKEELASALRMT
jgi:hypothetical protein